MGDGGSGSMSRRLSNKGYWLYHEATTKVIHETTWWRNKWLPPPPVQVSGDLLGSGGNCGVPKGWEERTLFCNEDYRLHMKLFCLKRQLEYETNSLFHARVN